MICSLSCSASRPIQFLSLRSPAPASCFTSTLYRPIQFPELFPLPALSASNTETVAYFYCITDVVLIIISCIDSGYSGKHHHHFVLSL